MFAWMQKWALRTNFTEVPLPISYEDKPMKVLVTKEEAMIVSAVIHANMELFNKFVNELHSAFNALNASQGKTSAEEASRIIVLNQLRHKYSELFTAMDEANKSEGTTVELNGMKMKVTDETE